MGYFRVGGILKHGVSGKQLQWGVYRQGGAYLMVTRARTVAQHIMTNSITATADDMKVSKNERFIMMTKAANLD